jgi:AraC-like DNA-binding protein
MNSATLLRKNLLAALQDRIIPSLRGNNSVNLASAHRPWKMPQGFSAREMPYPPLRESDSTRIYPEGRRWDAVHMHAVNCPALYCVIEGEADILVGVTTSMLGRVAAADRPSDPRGGYVLSTASPAFLLIPPNVPKRTGELPPWNRGEPPTERLRILTVRALPIGVLCHITTMEEGKFQVGYSLMLKDEHLAPLFGLLLDEASTPAPDAAIIHAQLLTLMLRLERALATQRPLMTDGLYSRFPDSDPTNLHSQLLHHPVIERAHNFIQLRLHEALTPALIAAHVRLTPTQLNRVFKAHAGISTMSYVAKLRLESAELLLRDSDLSVQEICRLVGYRQLAHFSRSFQRYASHSPLKFRQSQNQSQNQLQ